MKKLIVALFVIGAMALSGCASIAEKQEAAAANAKSQQDFIKTVADNKKPVCELVGISGQAISISGVQAFRCYSSDPAPVWQASAQVQSDGVEALKVIVGGAERTASGMAPYALGAAAVRGLTEGYKYVQAPGAVDSSVHTVGANSGTNSGNSGKQSGAALTDSNSGASSGNSGKQAGTTLVDATATATPTIVNPVVVQPAVVPTCTTGPC